MGTRSDSWASDMPSLFLTDVIDASPVRRIVAPNHAVSPKAGDLVVVKAMVPHHINCGVVHIFDHFGVGERQHALLLEFMEPRV